MPPTTNNDVLIVTDEQENAIKKMVDDRVKAKLEEQDRAGNNPIDPRQSANFKRWQKGLGGSPFSDTSSGDLPEHEGPGLRGLVKEMLASPQFKSFATTGAEEMHTFSPNHKSFFQLGGGPVSKAAQFTSISDARTALATRYDDTIVGRPHRILRIRDLLTVEQVTEGSVKFLQTTGFTNGVTMMPENIDPAAATAMSASTLNTQLVTVDIKTLSTKITVPVQALDDIPSLEDLITDELDSAIQDTEDSQILNGDNTGNNWKGFYPDSACQSNLWSDGELGDNEADAVLNAIVLAWLANHAPDAHIVGPAVWARFMKMKDETKNYLLRGVHRDGVTPMLWNLPMALSIAGPTGKVLTSSFRKSNRLYDRMQPTMWMSREHADNADKNLVTVFVNARGALGKLRPEATVKTTLDEAPEP